MNGSFRLLCRAESRRLVLLMAITLALVLAVQYFELPYTEVFTSLFAVGKNGSFPIRGSSSKSGMVDNVTLPNGLNSSQTYAINGTNINAGSNTSFAIAPSISSLLENGNNVVHGPVPHTAPEQFISLEQNVTKDYNPSSDTSSGSRGYDVAPSASPPVISQQILSDTKLRNSTSSVGENTTVMLKKDEDPQFLHRTPPSGNVYSENKVPAIRDKRTKTSKKPKKKSKKAPQISVSISEMNDLLQRSHASLHSVAPPSSSKVDQEVNFAKSQIVHAPIMTNDSGFYPSLYRNVSRFKRSYELMESLLKVYIYQEGEKPIFHEGILEGIYAAEGWFIKLLEANKKFVTEEPQKAHLFFLPFSSRLLELTVYVRNSHSRTNLIQYMRNYVDMIAAKHPFWNRTDGADHFLVACHDWAPAETRGRLLNSIRALCNADTGVGFIIGKDVSLPETYVRSANDPLKSQGGNPPSQRHILAFFAGNMHGYVRPILLNYWGNDPDMKIYGPMPHVKGNTNYIDHMKSSKFCICARGHEVNSPRVVEAIFYECVPVIISDNFVPPLFEVLNWESFAIFVLEKDIPNLKNILLSISEERFKTRENLGFFSFSHENLRKSSAS
ncbi:Exostosin-like protein [Corchorus capsularis]|uniref:Exostosin-like protein n=1 Tax=Corchorus capsularis TaxID=210143 RepID=A0A1R3K556_COCAP|nr:Exostosin-like protein [Corchorus capsularis]